MTERERQRAIRLKLARSESKRVARILTGFESLDAALEGGLPRGQITEISGPSGAGKTRFALNLIANLQLNGLAAAWIDAERAFDPAFAVGSGVSLERLPVVRVETAEEALEIARQLAGSGGIDLLALDSAAALTPAMELEIGVGDSGPGLQARVLASGFRRLASAAAKTETAVVVLNQLRSGAFRDAAETSAGGPALKLYAAVRIALEALKTGSGAHFRILKSRLAAGAREGEIVFAPPPDGSEGP